MKLVVSSYQQLKFAWILFVWTKNTRQKSPRSADEKMLVKCSFTKIVIENSSTSHALRDGECTTIRRNRTPFNTKMKIKEIKLPHIFFSLFVFFQFSTTSTTTIYFLFKNLLRIECAKLMTKYCLNTRAMTVWLCVSVKKNAILKFHLCKMCVSSVMDEE